MKTTSLQVRIPQALRKEADIVLDSVGLDMSTAIRVYLKKIVSTRSIPFALVAEDSHTLRIPIHLNMYLLTMKFKPSSTKLIVSGKKLSHKRNRLLWLL